MESPTDQSASRPDLRLRISNLNGGNFLAIYYFEDENGTYFSEDGSRKFIRLKGKAAYEYIREHNSDHWCFYRTTTNEEYGEKVLVEVREKDIESVRAEQRREQYVADSKNQSNIHIISLSQLLDEEEYLSLEDQILPVVETSVEDDVAKLIEFEMLRRALRTLTDDELRILYHLYLSEKRVSEKALSRMLNVPASTLNYRKQHALKKVREFFYKK